MPWKNETYLRWLPPLTWQCDPQVMRVLAALPPGARVVDLGAGGRQVSPNAIAVDFTPFSNTRVVADVQRLPFACGAFDVVIATGLLEHVEDARAVIGEIARVLRPGGIVHIEVPFLQQYHTDPIDCRRYTISGLERELAEGGLMSRRAGFHIGPTVMILTLLTHYIAMWVKGPTLAQRAMSTAVFAGLSAAFWPFKFLDKVAMRLPDASSLCFGVYCTAEKAPAGARLER
jgi:SAM-dependent methyltransferase